MLQLVIWGIALLLVVKGLDVLHQQSIVRDQGHNGAPGLAGFIALLAILGAAFLVIASEQQGSSDILKDAAGRYRMEQGL